MALRTSERQWRLLLKLGSGSTVLAGRKGDWGSLLVRGLVEPDPAFEVRDSSRYVPPLRITADGYRALAAGVGRWRDGGAAT